MKLGKEITIDCHDNYSTTIGVMNRKKPRAIFFEICSWVTPKQKLADYDKSVKRLTKQLRSELNNIIDPTKFSKDFVILDLDLRSSGISTKNRSFVSIDVTLYQVDLLVPLEELKPTLKEMINKLIKVMNNSDDFTFNKRKKKLEKNPQD